MLFLLYCPAEFYVAADQPVMPGRPMLQDRAGHAVSGATAEALALFETALSQLHCHTGEPLETVEAAIAAAPDFTMAHLLRAHLCLSSMEEAGIAAALQSIARARRVACTERESLHIVAAETWAGGRFQAASQCFDDILLLYPRDSLALQMGHLLDFHRGDMRSLHNRVRRVLPAWDAALPHHQATLRMLAFGLEQDGDDAASGHATHWGHGFNPREAGSLEMFMATHNWWHLVLHHLDHEEHVEVPCGIGRPAGEQSRRPA